jgi:hypothetical protein
MRRQLSYLVTISEKCGDLTLKVLPFVSGARAATPHPSR